jgi:CRP/FNR family transcriptional regulator, cyclic AMP receptor protein
MPDDARLAFAARALAASPLFRTLPPERVDLVARALLAGRFRKGQVVFHQGDDGDAMYLVESGLVKISAESVDGQEAILTELRSGETFGELALLDGAPRSATAIAVEDTVTLRLPRAAFDDLLDTDATFPRRILEALAHELRRATHHVGELHFLDLPGRLAARLARMAREADREGTRDVRLGRYYSQSELAAMIGGTRQSVNRYLGEFVSEGLIRIERDDIVVVDVLALERRSEW